MVGMKTMDMNRNEVGGLVSLDPSFVRHIAVVSRTGSLLTLSSAPSSLTRSAFNAFTNKVSRFCYCVINCKLNMAMHYPPF